ncbi:FMN-dependent NADH-azoreductase [Vibrio sp. SM6]|uniref:FMN dependent NADH:quinone oxidoreductase n=1 Tax=Vibrio agarilyticus TaxID=2726741 RepID=A0A7X8TT83_9VIBR|nr:FMN-dependent NADH-azoreductase [Vibrio agarilyticus]NLS14391.1 FMN-dependent NADH-azoreductase [Vibrio agarilyticus]
MTQVLALKSSILGEHSQSNKLVEQFISQPANSAVITRDLAAEPLPILDAAAMAALTANDPLHPIVSLSNTLIEEIKTADTLVIGAPMYNFTVPTQLKNWFDLIARAGVTFRYSSAGPQGLLTGKKAIVITTRGGVHKAQPSDVVTPYLRAVLSFVGIVDIEFVYAEGLAMGDDSVANGLADAQKALNALNER